MKVKSGDMIIVLSGKDKGKKGKVLKAFPKDSVVVVEGVNVLKRHQKARKAGQKGQVVEKAMPVHVSNVAVLDPDKNVATRVGYSMVGGKKVRIAKKSGSSLDK